MTTAAAWRWCLAAGLLTVACSIGFGRIPGLHPCGGASGLGAILAFEFARTPADVAALFGSDPCRTSLIAAQRTGLWLDVLGFIPSYTAFLCCGAWATGSRLRGWIVGALVAAGLCDQIEGALLFAILRDLPGTPGQLDALWWPVHIKFALLAGGTGAIGLGLLGRSLSATLLGLLVSGFGLSAVVTLAGGAHALMMQCFTGAWSVLLLVAGVGAVWPRLLAPRPPAPAVPNA